MGAKLLRVLDGDDAIRVEVLHSAKRLPPVEELAAAVSFLAGPESSFITGQTLDAGGGWIVA